MLIKATEKERQLIMNYCLAEPTINLFIIGDIENFGFDTDFQEIWIQTVDERITGIVLRYHDNFILYSRNLDMDFDEVKTLINSNVVRIISGKCSVIELLYPLIKDKYSKRDMYFCELKDASRLIEDTSGVVTAQEEDAMEIALAYEKIEEFSGVYSSGLENRYKQITCRIVTKEGVHMFISQDGTIVSHGNTTAETSVSGMIGGVLTLPEYRNLGHASKVVSALCKSLISRGKLACLFFDNPKAGNIYYRLGFENIGKWCVLGVKEHE